MYEFLLLEIERLKQMLFIAAKDISNLDGSNKFDYLHDLSTRDYFEEVSTMKCPSCEENKNITVIQHINTPKGWTAPCECNKCGNKFTYPDDCIVEEEVVDENRVQGSLF